jgi:hypothetical protein
MFTFLFVVAYFCQPGLPYGIIPGMTTSQVEHQLMESSSGSICFGVLGYSEISEYSRSRLFIRYELGRVVSVSRAGRP